MVFDTVVHNEHIEYHSGIVLIMQPGYYTFTVQGRNGVKGRELALYILIDNRRVALAKRYGTNAGDIKIKILSPTLDYC